MWDNTSGVTQDAGGKLPNLWGLFDLVGNVQEWCWDWHEAGYYSISPDSDPRGPATGTNRIHRGGHMAGNNSDYSDFRSGFRAYDDPSFADGRTGFRVVRLIPDQP